MTTLDLAVIGNCTFGALIDARASIRWCCMPRFDSDPVFCGLLDEPARPERGVYDIELQDFQRSEQHYRDNSAVVVTRLYDTNGGVVEVTDFAPRFKHFGRVFRPPTIVRHLRPLSGSPRVRLRVRPAHDYGRGAAQITRGSNHVRYVMPHLTLRLTTDAPITYLVLARVGALSRAAVRVAGGGDPRRDHAEALQLRGDRRHRRRDDHLDSGGAGSGRNWDYRYCWLRDAYFVVHALNRLGATKTMEDYLAYICQHRRRGDRGERPPPAGLRHRLEKRLTSAIAALPGYRGMGPVRSATRPSTRSSTTSTAASSSRRRRPSSTAAARPGGARRVRAARGASASRPGALGPARRRPLGAAHPPACTPRRRDVLGRLRPAGADRRHLGLPDRATAGATRRPHPRGLLSGLEPERGASSASFGGDDLDASLLLLERSASSSPDDPRFAAPSRGGAQLKRGHYLLRYAEADDFGAPETPSTSAPSGTSTRWPRGRREEARELFENMLACAQPRSACCRRTSTTGQPRALGQLPADLLAWSG
jgi:hypothetical protein